MNAGREMVHSTTQRNPGYMHPIRSMCGLCLPFLAVTAGCEPVVGGRTQPAGPGGLEVLFRVAVDGSRNAFVPTSDGVRLYADVDRRIEAFDLGSGARLWSYTRPPGGPSALVARGGRVMFAGDSAVALDAATGRELWKRGLDSHAGFAESDGDAEAFFTGTEQRYIYGFRASDGELLWRTRVGEDWPHGGVVRGITLSGDTLYAVVEHNTGVNGHIGTGDVFAMDRRTGAVHWVYRNGNGTGLNIFQSAGRVAGRLLLLTANWDNQFLAIDRFSRDEEWRFSAGFSFAGPQEAPEVRGNVAYVASHAENALALDLSSGRTLWTTGIRGGGNWLAICGNVLLVHASSLEILDLASGRTLGRGYGPESNEVLGTDLVVVGNRAYVFGLRDLYGFECPT
jgi:outer membrane protein assembly factor BamB